MDSLYKNSVWIIASALSRVCRLADSLLAKIKIKFLLSRLDLCYQQRSFIGLTARFSVAKVTENSKIISFTKLQIQIPKICKKVKSSIYTKSPEIELISHFNSVYQSKPPLLLFPNVLGKLNV